jgi:hypothetical protein
MSVKRKVTVPVGRVAAHTAINDLADCGGSVNGGTAIN